MNKKTVVFDFDGVIHSYTSGWIGDTAIPDPPFPGIREAIVDIRKKYRVVVVSTRCASEEGKAAIKEWLAKYDIVVDDITKEKPPAVVYIDDRAICFDGHADLLAARIEAFQPFYSAKHAGFLTFEDAQKWYDAYHRVKHELERERMCHRETEKLADKYFAECKHLQQMLEAAIAGQETLQQYFLTPDKPDGIMARYNEKTGKWDKYEPYMTIECPEENDYEFLKTAIEKQVLKKPLKESLADYGCPTCRAHINFDGLNGNVEHAPKYCSECGQRLDWRKDNNEQRTD